MNQKKDSVLQRIHTSLSEFGKKHLYSRDIQIKDKCFLLLVNLMIVGTILVVPAMFFVKQYLLATIYAISVVLLVGELFLISKLKKYEMFETLTCFAFLFMIPVAFSLSGGFEGGTLFFFLLGIVFSYVVLRGAFRVFYICLSIIEMLGIIVISINYPQLLYLGEHKITQEVSIIANTVSCLISAFVLICIFSYQIYLHEIQEKLLEKKEEEAMRANVAKSMFLANMSHEIRTPMGVVIGLSDMIQREDNIEAIHGMAKNINRTSGLLLNIINDILDFEKVSKGMMDIIDDVYKIDDVIGDFGNIGESRCVAKGLEYTIKKTDTVPEYVYGDETRFRQIGTNIINNAIKYTDKGFVEVTIDYNAALEKLILIVKDSGKGIKKEDLPYIFDSFQRVDAKSNKHIEGTGLGLSITKRLAQAMGGSVSVISEYGKGSIFTVEVAHKKAEAPKTTKDEEAKAYDFSNKRILYVDDTKVNTLVFNGMLKETKAMCTFAFSGLEALEKLRDEEFDIIFLDYFMPEMDGIEVFHKIREMGIETPIVVLTADAVNNAKEKFISVGFDDYISKPIQRPALISIIDRLS